MRTPKIPPGTRHLRTFAELNSYMNDIIANRYPLLWVFGRPGIRKSQSILEAARGHRVYYRKSGQLTPAQFYIDCYHHRGEPIILDDAEHLLDNKVGAKLISALGETSPAKFMSYSTTSRVLGEVPPSYYTTSPVCLLANEGTMQPHMLSRGLNTYFDPNNLEIHQDCASWFWDQEIHDWFGQHLYRLPPLDIRWYFYADRDKRAGRNWQQLILTTHVPQRAICVVQDLESDPAYPTREDKSRRFIEIIGTGKGASRSTYHRTRKRLVEAECLIPQTVPSMLLRHTTPPSIPSIDELDSLGDTPLPAQPEAVPYPLDLPGRQAFQEPIRGQPTPPAPRPPMNLDDAVPWETRRGPVDDDEA